jgi:selenocysteine-specific elongation factor
MATAERLPSRASRRIIVGTAGHIDHGKTALVKALTGIDADRLQEEKRRGITIDIGFANLDLPAPGGTSIQLGFIDVPGHERFVRNMLAGVGGIDLVLFVIAADEGIMPQTREHFDICRLLSVRRGITVLTKSDLVDEATLAIVRAEIEDFLRGSFLDPAVAPVVPVSSLTGSGIAELRRALESAAGSTEVKNAGGYFRLPIDRVFTMKGFGTVVTGTLLAGSIKRDDEIEIFPQRARARVRNVQVHGKSAQSAFAGERTALNLAGNSVSKEELARGMTLSPPALFQPSQLFDVSLALLPSARPLRNRARVHLHLFTQETIAEVTLHGAKELVPGKGGLARLRTAEPLLALPGDRFIIRQFSPVTTIGGGAVLDASPIKASRAALQVLLQKLQTGQPSEILAARIARRGSAGISIDQAIAETGSLKSQLESLASELVRAGIAVRSANQLFATTVFDSACNAVSAAAEAFHDKNLLVPGLTKEELRARSRLPLAIFEAAFAQLLVDKKLRVTGELAHVAGRGVVMKDEEADAKRLIEQAFKTAGLKVPAVTEVLGSLKIDRARAHRIVALLLREKTLVSLGDDLIFHREALENLRALIQGHKNKSAKIGVSKFKELVGVTRKYAIPLLEYLDRQRITRRVGDERVIL